jgi:LuxR family transcriptional regulator, maltose regulon positive regulatory protein
MSTPILATKLYIPPLRPSVIPRPRLIARLNEGLQRRLTLISASAGFGKTTLLSEWVVSCGRPVVWLALDERDGDPARFLTYLIAALRGIAPQLGEGVLGALQSSQAPPAEAIMTALLNEIAGIERAFILVLDDYHAIDAPAVDAALAFMLEHLPPQMHIVIATREDPNLPLARLRARGQLAELRVAQLRFTSSEVAKFLSQAMGLQLAAEAIDALETRTEGWVAGLQLAALSLQGHRDPHSFIRSFTGTHHFVLDYLLEEVLQQQPAPIQAFLLHTSILDRLCGPLCDAVLHDPAAAGQATLEYLERANLFVVPLDSERRWYRYHHLFADLLRQRLRQGSAADVDVAELHIRASAWYEGQGLDAEAFQHAAAAGDLDRATRLVEGAGMPLFFRGEVTPVLRWLESLPTAALDAHPSLWVMYASALLFVSRMREVEQKLQSAEAALQGRALDDATRDLVGHIAAIRATLAVSQHDLELIVAQSRRALEHLHPNNLPVRTATTWTLGYAYYLQGERAAAGLAYTEALAISEAIGHRIIMIMATLGLGTVQEVGNQLPLAAQSYRRVLELIGDPPLPVACEAHLGLARIFYEWDDLESAQQHGRQAAELARQLENTDRYVAHKLFLARLELAHGNVAGAAALVTSAGELARQQQYVRQLPEVAAMQVRLLLRHGSLAEAAQLAQAHDLPHSQARVHLAQGDAPAALALLDQRRRAVEERGWADEQLRVMLLQSLALHAHHEEDRAEQLLRDLLTLAEPGGFIRLFIDEGPPMAQLLARLRDMSGAPHAYLQRLLAAFDAPTDMHPSTPRSHALIEPLSQRELEVLQLIAQGLSNQEISERLFLALSTVKGHNQRIFDKLQAQRRTEAIARARELGLL